jgi:hypothetical protein
VNSLVTLFDSLKHRFSRTPSIIDIPVEVTSIKKIETSKKYGHTARSNTWHEFGSGYGTISACGYSPVGEIYRAAEIPIEGKLCKHCKKDVLNTV